MKTINPPRYCRWIAVTLLLAGLAQAATMDTSRWYRWDFENAGKTNYVASLENHEALKLIGFYRDVESYFTTNDFEKGKTALWGRVDTPLDRPPMMAGYKSGLTLMYWAHQHTVANIPYFMRVSSGSTCAPGSLALGGVADGRRGYRPQFYFVGTNGVLYTSHAGFLVSSGQWEHVALTFNKGVVQWYSNGEARNSTDLSKGGREPAATFIPAATRHSIWQISSGFGDNALDDVGIFGEALSARQIETAVKSGIGTVK